MEKADLKVGLYRDYGAPRLRVSAARYVERSG
jgi:hypothetical protein